MGANVTKMPDISKLYKMGVNVAKGMDDTVEFAKEAIIDVVETSGTDREWSRPWYGRSSSGRGRVDTGEMRDAVGSDVFENGDVITGAAGWLKGDPDYSLYQNVGFRHYLTGEMVEGMKAISSVRDEVYQEFGHNMGEALRRTLK